MGKKGMFYLLGVLAVATLGTGIYFFMKDKKANKDSSGGNTLGSGSGSGSGNSSSSSSGSGSGSSGTPKLPNSGFNFSKSPNSKGIGVAIFQSMLKLQGRNVKVDGDYGNETSIATGNKTSISEWDFKDTVALTVNIVKPINQNQFINMIKRELENSNVLQKYVVNGTNGFSYFEKLIIQKLNTLGVPK